MVTGTHIIQNLFNDTFSSVKWEGDYEGQNGKDVIGPVDYYKMITKGLKKIM